MATTVKTAAYEAPGRPDTRADLKPRYENFIGGHWIAPISGQYSQNIDL